MPISRRGLWIVLVVLAVVAVGERWLVPGWLASRGPMGPARWISAPVLEPPSDPEEAGAAPHDVGFFAFRDFEVDEDFEGAELKVMGEEAFWVNLNGVAVAAGRWDSETRLRACEVGPYLHAGRNRLVVELRSSRPSGGLLLSLEIGGKRPQRIVTDSSWSIVRRHQRELGEAGADLAERVPARVWGAPPTGRWGWPREEARQPALVELMAPGGAVPAARARVGDPAGTWFRLPPRPEQAAPLARWVTFDFGAPQTGLLSLVFAERGPVRGLVFAGATPPDPRAERPDAVLLKVPGLKAWTRVVPRRFRYVTVISPTKVQAARVYPVVSDKAAALLEEPPPPTGAFGMELALRTPVEDEIWRDFERLASVRGGKPIQGSGGL